ncbi:MAG: dihydropteroate synthase [Spirochaetaceae bacterium]|nr:dihydropteroate synthase [Spirochaetaceae bacterium]
MTNFVQPIYFSKRIVTTDLPAFVMGILNATPDSFYAGNRGTGKKKDWLQFLTDKALKMIASGVDILDIGGESTRPGSNYVDATEEIARIIPLIKEIRKFSDCPISIDTRKKIVLEAALDAGADMLNDVSALEDDELMASFVAAKNIPVVLMHKRGIPAGMQENTSYEDVVAEVCTYLQSRVAFALSAGIKKEKIILDPGIGFGKDLSGNISLIKNMKKISENGKFHSIMALSRKRCIGEMCQQDVDNRLFGTLAANLVSVCNGATILRVHDVAETIDVLKVLQFFPEIINNC